MTIFSAFIILLQAGDEIYQVNGYKVSDAVHRELSKYIASQDRITLRVRGRLNYF